MRLVLLMVNKRVLDLVLLALLCKNQIAALKLKTCNSWLLIHDMLCQTMKTSK